MEGVYKAKKRCTDSHAFHIYGTVTISDNRFAEESQNTKM